MPHDQLAKTLIATFFADFLRLTLPESAPLLRLGEAVFIDKEVFTDWPDGKRRELDLLARVPVEQEEKICLLIHVEIESRAREAMKQRLWGYYMQIRLKYKLLVLPILVNLRGGRPGVSLVAMEEGFEPTATGLFRYRALGLSGCRAADWLVRAEPLAWAPRRPDGPGRVVAGGAQGGMPAEGPAGRRRRIRQRRPAPLDRFLCTIGRRGRRRVPAPPGASQKQGGSADGTDLDEQGRGAGVQERKGRRP